MRVRDFSFPRKIHTTLNAAGEVGGGRSDPPPPPPPPSWEALPLKG